MFYIQKKIHEKGAQKKGHNNMRRKIQIIKEPDYQYKQNEECKENQTGMKNLKAGKFLNKVYVPK